MEQEVKKKNSINTNIFNSEEEIAKTIDNFAKLKPEKSNLEVKKSKSIKQIEKVKEKPIFDENKSQNKQRSAKNCFLLSYIKKYKIIFIPVFIILILILFITLFFILKNKKGKDNISQDKPIILTPEPYEYKIKNEFNILTKADDLKHISITQISKEETKMNSEIISNKITRKTNYDIYFESEEEASEENKKL